MWIEKAGPLVTFGDNSKGLSEGYGCLQADSSDEFNKDGDLRTPIAPPMTSLRMAKVIFLVVPGVPNGVVGFDQPLKQLNEMLLKDEVKIMVIYAPGGCGKINLAKMLCSDPEIKILDDVWHDWVFHIDNLLIFTLPNFKILVTSRYSFQRFKHVYNLEILHDQDAMTLFCQSALSNDGMPTIPYNLVEKVVKLD
ncbi:hypothetical protein AgCh_031760 [Apium graveolens]